MADLLVRENIPDSALLFRRIHRIFLNPETSRISSGAFDGLEMSVNWNRYTSAAETAAQDQTGNTVAIASLNTEFCRSLQLEVLHDPIPANPAHSIVKGKKSKPIKHQLRDAAVLVWRKETSV
jgi:hypothetical protein